MRESKSKLIAEGFRVEEVEATKYSKDGVSFISVDGFIKNDDVLGKFTVTNPEGLVRVGCDKTDGHQENKVFEERLQELKDTYAGVSDFDFITVLNLEDEYNIVTKDTPDHTKKRSEVLEMRRRLMDRFRWKNQ